MSRELVDAIKQAHREMEEEKRHEQVHAYITSKIAKGLLPSQTGMAKCGICDQLIMYRAAPDVAQPTPVDKSDKE